MQHIPGGKGPNSYSGALANTSIGNDGVEGIPPTAYFLAVAGVLKEYAIRMGGKATPPDQKGNSLKPFPPTTQDPNA